MTILKTLTAATALMLIANATHYSDATLTECQYLAEQLAKPG